VIKPLPTIGRLGYRYFKSNPSDLIRFSHLLHRCYARDSIGIPTLRRRLSAPENVVWMAAIDGRLAAISIVREDGKRVALGVLPRFRNLGIASRLIAESLNYIPHQFSEVRISNNIQAKLLIRNNFSYIYRLREAIYLLGNLHMLVHVYFITNGILAYRRSSLHNIRIKNDFFLLSSIEKNNWYR
jgi:GNAT superfamily N-acetyltransferase